MTGESAQQFYENFLTQLRKQYKSEMIKGMMITSIFIEISIPKAKDALNKKD